MVDIRRRVLLLGGFATAAFSGCTEKDGPQHASAEEVKRDTHDTLEEVGLESHALALGRFVGEATSHSDDGGQAGAGVQKVWVIDFAVERSNPAALPKTIKVALPEASDRPKPEDLSRAQPHALFLERVRAAERGGLQELGDLYLPIGGGASMFTVSGDTASPLAVGETRRKAESTSVTSVEKLFKVRLGRS